MIFKYTTYTWIVQLYMTTNIIYDHFSILLTPVMMHIFDITIYNLSSMLCNSIATFLATHVQFNNQCDNLVVIF